VEGREGSGEGREGEREEGSEEGKEKEGICSSQSTRFVGLVCIPS